MKNRLKLLTVILIGLPAVLMAATSMATNGITFTFNKDYTTGRFVDGEPWVIGPVTITAMSPAYSGGRNGYEVNPVSGNPWVTNLDDRLPRGSRQSFTAPAALPRLIQPGSSVLKVKSAGSGLPLLSASVLTVLDQAPPANSFRPGYCGKEKTIHSAVINIDAKLPKLSDVPGTPSLSNVECIFGNGGPWLEHKPGSFGGSLWPQENMRRINTSTGTCVVDANGMKYGANFSLSVNTALARLTQSGTAAQKQTLVRKLVQVGIDYYSMWKNGKVFYSDGGIHGGRKGLVLFAGYMLDNAAMMNLGNQWHEDMMTYKVGDGEACFGDFPTQKSCPTSSNVTGRADRNGDGQGDGDRDGGCCKNGTYCDKNGDGWQPTLAEQRATGLFSMTNYQIMSSIYIGVVTWVRQLGLEKAWDHPALFEYVDRIATPPWNYYCRNYCSSYLTFIHKIHGKKTTGVAEETGQPEAGHQGLFVWPQPIRNTAVFIRQDNQIPGAVLAVYDGNGSLVRRLVPSGPGKVYYWDGKNSTGRSVDAGIYFIECGPVSQPIILAR